MSPGDPRECRLRAAECFRMAEQATSAQGRIEFNDFAKVWLRLATEFEKDNALLDMWSGPENGPHEAWPRRVAGLGIEWWTSGRAPWGRFVCLSHQANAYKSSSDSRSYRC